MDLDRLKANVFPGESGGDYSALFGYSNRPGGQFEGVNLTDMTVDEALQFANPSGPYGQWVKGQVGRVATPMGAFQVVGSTLRAAKEGLGLTGSERMTPETQDRIGQWIYQTQGPNAWEAWGKGGNMQPQGLLGTMSTRNAPEQEQLPFFQRPQTQDILDTLAIGFGGMTLNPNQALIQSAQERIGARREERQATAQLNKTLEYLRREAATNPAAAQALRYAGATGDVSGALKIATASGAQYRQITGPDAAAMGLDPNRVYNIGSDGKVSGIGGGDTILQMGGQITPGQEAIDKKFAETWIDWTSGGGADAMKQIAQLRGVTDRLASGEPITGPALGLQPDVLQSMFNPEALNARQQVEEVVQRNLRAVLGAQFTQAEGDRLIARAFDQRLSPQQNAARLSTLIQQMEAVAQAKSAMVNYFNQRGTLQGFEAAGVMPTVADFEATLDTLDLQMGVDTGGGKTTTQQFEAGTPPPGAQIYTNDQGDEIFWNGAEWMKVVK